MTCKQCGRELKGSSDKCFYCAESESTDSSTAVDERMNSKSNQSQISTKNIDISSYGTDIPPKTSIPISPLHYKKVRQSYYTPPTRIRPSPKEHRKNNKNPIVSIIALVVLIALTFVMCGRFA